MLKEPFSVFINKFDETRFDNGMVATAFGNHKLANESFSIKFKEIYLEDLNSEQMATIKVGQQFECKFDEMEVEHGTSEKKYILNTKEAVIFEIIEVLDTSAASSGSILVKVDEVVDFE